MLTPKQIERLVETVGPRPEVIAMYLFGSEAAGRAGRQSDVDVAVMVRGRLSGFERIALETALSSAAGRDVDLVIFGDASPLLKHQILKAGRRLYEADSRERVRQEVDGRYEYMDTRHLHRELRG